MKLSSKKRILACPLDWGIGHATRLIPVIYALLEQGHTIILGADKKPLAILREEFPELPHCILSSYDVKYSSTAMGFLRSMVLQTPKILFYIWKEHQQLKRLIDTKKIDVVLSDNRFGLFNKSVKTIFITHQITIQVPKTLQFLEKSVRFVNHLFIKQFNELWIPDYENSILSGELSQNLPEGVPVTYLGSLSRFYKLKEKHDTELHAHVLVVLSGPEPQRTILERKVIVQLQNQTFKSIIVRGVPSGSQSTVQEEVTNQLYKVDYLNSSQLLCALKHANTIVCRAGYSSIMDLVAIGRTALLIPTPGQTEQEYLARYLSNKGWFFTQSQNNLNISVACKEIRNYSIPEALQSTLEFRGRV